MKPKYFRFNQSVKTIDINGLEWFDRVNGNSYFAATVIINYGMKNEFSFNMPFQYGYGDFYIQRAFEKLEELKICSKKFRIDHSNRVRATIEKNCKQSQLKSIKGDY